MSKIIAQYLLQEIIGSGEYGIVYRARHLQTHQLFAIKQVSV